MNPPATTTRRRLAAALAFAAGTGLCGGSAFAQQPHQHPAAATAATPATSATAATAAPRVDAAWARPTVQGQSGGGAYLRITGGAAADRLLGASAPVARTVELHTMQMDGNVMRMREVAAIDVPAGKTVELAPGGLHVMLVGMTQTLKNGASFPLTLRFEKGGSVTVDVAVTPVAPGGAGGAGAAAGSQGHGHKH